MAEGDEVDAGPDGGVLQGGGWVDRHRRIGGGRDDAPDLEEVPVVTLLPRPPHRSSCVDERLNGSGVDEGAVQAEDAAEGDQVVLEPEFLAALEPDAVDDPHEVAIHRTES